MCAHHVCINSEWYICTSIYYTFVSFTKMVSACVCAFKQMCMNVLNDGSTFLFSRCIILKGHFGNCDFGFFPVHGLYMYIFIIYYCLSNVVHLLLL